MRSLWVASSILMALMGSSPVPGIRQEKQVTQRVVCIDPGHSKKTVGTRSKKVIEYKVCWRMALKLKKELEARNIRVVLTKASQDENVENEDRAAVANRERADLFVRLHCDFAPQPGICTFFPDRQGEKDGVRGPSTQIIATSRESAKRFHAAMIKSLGSALQDKGIRPDIQTSVGGRQGALTGSIFSHVPVLLVEMCVLNKAHDEAFIASEKGQNLLAKALAEGTIAAVNPGKE